MKRCKTPALVGRRYGVTPATVIEWCENGVMPAVDVASETATRRRWRMSEEDIEAFEARRGNREAVPP
ncbi:MAG TPA: DNA-binding protein [Fuerstia sp.]|nr:DNA-binding protein [Fuerstiella sp.]